MFDSGLGDHGTLDDLADSCVSSEVTVPND